MNTVAVMSSVNKNNLEKRNLFKGFSFTCQFLEPENNADFIKIVKDLGAEVKDDAPYIFTNKITSENIDKNYYNVCYLLDSIKAGKPLDIELYRFLPANLPKCPNGSMRCYMAKFASKNQQYQGLNYKNNVFCEACLMEYKKDLKKTNNININKTKIIDEAVQPLEDSEVQKKIIQSNDETLVRNDPKESKDCENSSSDLNSAYKNYEVNFNSIRNVNSELKKITPLEKMVRNPMSIKRIKIDKSEPTNIDHSSSSKIDKWWLIQHYPGDNICKISSCTFEPNRHQYHPIPQRLLSMYERQIILKYLIQSKNISHAKGIKVYYDMNNNGYLKHRSVETLRNCLRRRILPHIKDYQLPHHIEQEFLKLLNTE